MPEWGRKEYPKWPSRNPVWSWSALLLLPLLFAATVTLQYEYGWNHAEKMYLASYLRSITRCSVSPRSTSRYALLEGDVATGGMRPVVGDEVESKTGEDGRPFFQLTEEGAQNGLTRLHWEVGNFNDGAMSRFMRRWIYRDQTLWDYVQWPLFVSLIGFALGLCLAVPKDRKNRLLYQHGRRLRGPEFVTTEQFNKRLGIPRVFPASSKDGIAFINEERSRLDKILKRSASGWARIPRNNEAMHFLIVGDSGTGKSAAIRQILAQIWERGEVAIVYDPAMEYLPQFYNPGRGDVILNPLDERCPFWSPGAEVPHEAEALTLAASLFPDQGKENRFFVEAPRKIFAHLLNLKPTPEELTHWMCHAEEIDRRVEGTELEAMIDRHAAAQRSGVLGSLNMVADAFKLLPNQLETSRKWNTVDWAKERKGWIFLTSKPTMRARLRPLMSLWLDLLVLRMMNDGSSAMPKTWFVLDELASLQHLPQLTTAVTENRKSNNPMVLGFQGKAQVESLYGHIAEAMLSQPATKIFLKTSEPNASEWISKAIGEIEVERFRESRTHGRFPRNSGSEQRDITREPLVMASEIAGLDPLHGYLKHGNLVLRMRFPYLDLPNKVEKFIERARRATSFPVTKPDAIVSSDDQDRVLPFGAERRPAVSVSKENVSGVDGAGVHFD